VPRARYRGPEHGYRWDRVRAAGAAACERGDGERQGDRAGRRALAGQARDRGRQPAGAQALPLGRRHGAFSRRLDAGYDCSGAVSYALYGGRFLASPLASGELAAWARPGAGSWITIYANAAHAYLVVAGLRFDTSMRDPDPVGPLTGPRWSARLRAPAGYLARHPRGY
jgi:hypothetical protein